MICNWYPLFFFNFRLYNVEQNDKRSLFLSLNCHGHFPSLASVQIYEVIEFVISWPRLVDRVQPIPENKYSRGCPSMFATSSLSAAEVASRKALGPLVRSHSQLWRWTASGKLDVIAAEKAKDLTSSALRKLDVWTAKLFQLSCYAPLEAWAEKS